MEADIAYKDRLSEESVERSSKNSTGSIQEHVEKSETLTFVVNDDIQAEQIAKNEFEKVIIM